MITNLAGVTHFFFPFKAELTSGTSFDLLSGYVFYVFDIFRSKLIKLIV